MKTFGRSLLRLISGNSVGFSLIEMTLVAGVMTVTSLAVAGLFSQHLKSKKVMGAIESMDDLNRRIREIIDKPHLLGKSLADSRNGVLLNCINSGGCDLPLTTLRLVDPYRSSLILAGAPGEVALSAQGRICSGTCGVQEFPLEVLAAFRADRTRGVLITYCIRQRRNGSFPSLPPPPGISLQWKPKIFPSCEITYSLHGGDPVQNPPVRPRRDQYDPTVAASWLSIGSFRPCPVGQVVVAIRPDGSADCDIVSQASRAYKADTITGGRCGVGQLVVGIKSDGTPECLPATQAFKISDVLRSACRLVVTTGAGNPGNVAIAACNADEFLLSGGGQCEVGPGGICSGANPSFLHLSGPFGNVYAVDCYRYDWRGDGCAQAWALCCK